MNRPTFGRSRWAQNWIEALTERTRSEPNSLIRGRAYARNDQVADLDIGPGIITATVQADRPRPYAVAITVPLLDTAAWAILLDTVAGQLGHLAALLDGQLPTRITVDLDLCPEPSELRATCPCPEQVELCEHAIAACYLVAEAVDTDPFALMHLRGQNKDDVLAGLRSRRHISWSAPEGVLARDAYRRAPGPLPADAPIPPPPPTSVALPVKPPASSGTTAEELGALAALAARRAWDLLQYRVDPSAAG